MIGKECFIERFTEIWPLWRDDMEENIRYVEETRKQMYNHGHFRITPYRGTIITEFYTGGATEMYIWPIPESPERREACE